MSRKVRYWVSLIVTLVFCLGLFVPVATAQAAAELNDISDHWAEDTITKWIQRGFITGYTDGTFMPDKSITRAEFMTLVNKAFEFSEKASIGFSDVAPTDWFYDEVAKAVKAGYISGYQDGTAKPNQEISRQEAAVALCKALNLELQNNVDQFADKDSIPNWSRPYIGALAAKGYMGGYPDGTFRPERHITRAETVTMLDNALKALAVTYDEPGIYGPKEGIETISQDVAINVPGVTLRNMVIEGNLYLNEGIGEGDVTLENVTVKGLTTVRGGGKDSIHLVNFTCEEVIVVKVGGKIRIVASGNTDISELKLQSGAHVEGKGIETITILKAGEDIVLDGDFEEVIVDADVKVEVLAGTTINKLEINDKAQVDLAKNATVKQLTLEAAATITGKGTIEKAEINANGAKLEPEPKEYKVAEGVTAEVGGKEVKGGEEDKKPSTGGGSGGGSSRRIPVESVSILGPETVTLAVYEETTLTAKIEPANATNKRVTWSSSKGEIVTVLNPNSLETKIKALSKGEAIITVTTEDGNKTDTRVVNVVYERERSTYKLTYEDLADSYPVSELVDVTGKNQKEINEAVEAAIEGLTPIKVTLSTKELGKTGYEAVRFLPVGAGENIQLWAKDTSGNWYDINVTGWGKPSGFELPADYTATTEIYVLSDKAGEYELNIELVDLNDNNKVIAEISGMIKVVGLAETSITMSAVDVNATVGEEFNMVVTAKGIVAEDDKDHKVRFYGVISGLSAEDIVLAELEGGKPAVVTDPTERDYAGANEGDLVLAWGPKGGFQLGAHDYSKGVTTEFKATINKVGTYTVRFVFYDLDAGKQINGANETATITVKEPEYHTYRFDIEGKADVYIVREGLVNPSNDDFKDMTPVKLSIVVDEEKDKPYEGKVRVAPVKADGLQLWAKDTAGNWYDINQVGWGPSEGFVINPELVTPVYVIATKAIDDTITLKLVDITGNYGAEDNIIISQEESIKAVEDTEDPKITEAKGNIDENGALVLTVTATDNVGLAEIEVDHSLEGILPEFTVPAKSISDLTEVVEIDEGNPYKDQILAALSSANVEFNNGTWTLNFGKELTNIIVTAAKGANQDSISFYLVVRDLAGNESGSMYDGSYETVTVKLPEEEN